MNDGGKLYTVTKRANMVKQPFGGYIKPSSFVATVYNDGEELNENENVHGSIIGLAVDYLTRFLLGEDKERAFSISIEGAKRAKKLTVAKQLINSIKGLDDVSIVNACKLVTFDVWKRDFLRAESAKDYSETNPDNDTINNIRILINRSLKFFDEYGPITKDGFTFEPVDQEKPRLDIMIREGKSFGGYTATVLTGDGDFLTADTMWDFKVTKRKPTSKHTLQLLMYWIMGQHSGQEIFKGITKLGIFNPRLNTVYLYDMRDFPKEVIKEVEDNVICYED